MTDYFAGLDIGSTMTKAVIISENNSIISSVVQYSDPEHRRLANLVMIDALTKAHLKFQDISYIVSTGYGRMNVPFADRQITEISCHAKCISIIMPEVKTVIDIGGQDSKAIKIKNGKIIDFVMNDKCAAGTGRFIEIVAGALGIRLEDIGPISLTSREDITISSVCAVFTEQEIITKLSEGIAIPDVAAAVHRALATRISNMASKIKIEKEIALTGGGAKNIGLVKAMEAQLGTKVQIPDEPLLCGAYGAALFAKETVLKAKDSGIQIKRSGQPLQEVSFYR